MHKLATYKVTFDTGYSNDCTVRIGSNDPAGDDVIVLARLAADLDPPTYNSYETATMPVKSVERILDVYVP